MKSTFQYVPPPQNEGIYKYVLELTSQERLDIIQIVRRGRILRSHLSQPEPSFNRELDAATDLLKALGVEA